QEYLVADAQSEGGKQNKHQAHDQQNAARRRHFHQQRPKELLRYVERPPPPRQRPNLLPLDIPPVESVSGSPIRYKVRPQILELPAFTDPVPQIARARPPSFLRTVGWRRRIWRSAHRAEYRLSIRSVASKRPSSLGRLRGFRSATRNPNLPSLA